MITMLQALAESNRLHIVDLLRDGPRSVGEIVAQLRLHQPQVSKHLRVLSNAGLVEVYPVAQQRIYKLRSQPFRELDAWLDTFADAWSDRLDTFDAYLQTVKAERSDQGGDE